MSESVIERFNKDIERVSENQYGYLSGEDITSYYDEFGAPILDVIEGEDTMRFDFKMSSNSYTFKKGNSYGAENQREEEREQRTLRINRLNG